MNPKYKDITETNTRFLMVARTLPVVSGGTMIVLRRLLENFNLGEAFVLGRTPHQNVSLSDVKLNATLIEVPTPRIKGYIVWMFLSVIPGLFIGLRALRKHKIPVIIGVYPDEGSLLLAYLLHKVSGRPFMAYFCDLYLENKKGWKLKIARWLQQKVFNSATIISVNKAVQDFYLKTYQKDSLLIQTAINQEYPDNFQLPVINGKRIIGFSGSVVAERIDPMQDLIKAIGGDEQYELRIFSPQDEDFLKANNLFANNVKLKFCTSVDELMSELKQCHLLYLPLTFKMGSNSYEQLSTCFGIKSYEYLLSCRPIFVHCPPDYFTSSFFVENNCGYALGNVTPDELKHFISNDIFSTYDEKAPVIVRNGLKAAEQFKGDTLAKKLRAKIYSIVKP